MEDLSKGILNTAKLIKKPVRVRGKDGKVHTRMQWVKPGEDPNSATSKRREPVSEPSQSVLPQAIVRKEPPKQETREEKSKRMVQNKRPKTQKEKKKYNSPSIPNISDKLHSEGTLLSTVMADKYDGILYPEERDTVRVTPDRLKSILDSLFGDLSKEGIENALSSKDGNFEVSVDSIQPFDFSDYEDEDWNVDDLPEDELSETFRDTGLVTTDAVTVSFDIKDDTGEVIGTAKRDIDRDSDGTLVIVNAGLTIAKEKQGSGVANELYSNMEALWLKMTKTDDVKISIVANMTVGVYAWALKGFDFADDDGLEVARKQFDEFLDRNEMHKEKTFDLLGISGVDDLKSAKDFATLDDGFEYNLGIVGLKGYGSLGKAFMLSGKTMWNGARSISKGSDTSDITHDDTIHKSARFQKDLKWSLTKQYKGREGMTMNPDGSTTHDDIWLHSDMKLEKEITVSKSRKSVGRLPDNVEQSSPNGSNIKNKNKHTKLLLDLGLENFKEDVISTQVTKKSERLILDLNKADNKKLPKGAERYAYKVDNNYNVIYIPVNRLKQVYQTDESINPAKVNSNAKKMKENTPLEPIEIGYNYDVHDGHHRWEAAKKLGYTHVPCKVVGNDAEKVKSAREEYQKVWKSDSSLKISSIDEKTLSDLDRLSLDQFVKDLLHLEKEHGVVMKSEKDKKKDEDDKEDKISPDEIMSHYVNVEKGIDPIEDEKEWKEKVESNDKKFRRDLGISKSDVPLYLDILKGQLNFSKLVKKRVTVRGKNGKVHSRMQWVNPNQATGDMKHPGVDHSTFGHHEDGIKDLEKRQSNRFPVLHHETKSLKNMDHNYSTNKQEYAEAERKYNAGEKLPPVKINPRGEILENAHLVDLAKKNGISHVPVIVVGNPSLKKELETKLKRDYDGQENHEEGTDNSKSKPEDDKQDHTSSEMVTDLDHFLNFTKKKYTKQHLMKEAAKQGLSWKTTMNNGTELPENSNILWMHAHKAIVAHIKAGKTFEVNHVEKDVDNRMKTDGKDTVHKHFLKLLEKHGSKDALMAWGKDNGIEWKEKIDPSINWMQFVKAVKTELAKGKMIDGVRTRQKDAMKDANTVITDNIKDTVTAYGKKHGKSNVMKKAEEMGLQFDRFTKKGEQLPENSNILWMRAHAAIAKHIAQGGDFKMGGNNGITSQTGDYGDIELSDVQKIALDTAKRNSNNREDDAKKWALEAIMKDKEFSEEQADEYYKEFMEKAREKRVMIHFDPLELLPSGSTLLEQLSSDGMFKNDYDLNRGLDSEHREANERDMFGDEFDEANSSERPLYGVVDLFNKGLSSHPFNGEVAFVLKNDTKKRTTGSATDSNNIPYGEEGKHVRSMEDPHHLVMDRWQSKWKKVNKADKQRSRMFDSVMSDTPNNDDNTFFETHVHGGLKLDKDVDHLLVPSSWKSDSKHTEKHASIKNLAKQFGLDINYD